MDNKTKSTTVILDLVEKLKEWDCVNHLTDREFEGLIDDLFLIKYATINECKNNINKMFAENEV